MTEIIETYSNIGARLFMVIVVAGIFIWLNYEVMCFVKTVFAADLELAKATPAVATPRLVTSQVLQTLIGATVVQVGVATVTIMSYLFPKASK